MMRAASVVVTIVFLVFSLLPEVVVVSLSTVPTTTQPFAPNPATAPLKKELYRLCAGTRNGVDADEPTRQEIVRVVEALELIMTTMPVPVVPTELPLRGSRHELLYCESTGGSSGKIGPFVGDVEQLFAQDETNFINAVTIGPIRVELAATRTVVDRDRIKVTFQETTATLFGIELVKKPTTGAGIWKQRFVDDELRIMDTPSLFIIRRSAPPLDAPPAPTLVDVLQNPADYIADE